MRAWLVFFKYIHLNTFNLTRFMKTGYQHLLCRRDLSCTKVNAVYRLSQCLYMLASGCQEEAALPSAIVLIPLRVALSFLQH